MLLSLSRIKHLLYRDAIVYKKPILYGLFSLLAFSIFIFWIRTTDNNFRTYDAEFWVGWYFSFLFFGGIILTSIIFWEFKSPAGRMQFLSLPASNIEKLFSRGLYTHIFYPVILTLIWFIGFSIVKSLGYVDNSLKEFNAVVPDFMVYIFGAYLCAVSLMMIYAVALNKYVAPKAMIINFIVYLGLVLIGVIMFRIVYSDIFIGWEMKQNNMLSFDGDEKIKGIAESLTWFYKLVLWVIIPGFFMTVAYYKMKEKEV